MEIETALSVSCGKADQFFLVDLSWLLYRSYYTFGHLSVNVNGYEKPTGHIYGVLRAVMSFKKKFPRSMVVLCCDGHSKRRVSQDGEYKANREQLSYNIYQDVPDIIRLVNLIPETAFAYRSDLEADDCLFSLAKRFEREFPEAQIYIYSGDNDLLQAISERIHVFREFDKKGVPVPIDSRYIQEKFGVPPASLPIYRSIIGDRSDNVKGLPRFPRDLARAISIRVENVSEIGRLRAATLSPAKRKHFETLLQNLSLIERNFALIRLVEEEVPVLAFLSSDDKIRALSLIESYRIRSLHSFLSELMSAGQTVVFDGEDPSLVEKDI